jgi:hypothetical protein
MVRNFAVITKTNELGICTQNHEVSEIRLTFGITAFQNFVSYLFIWP